MRGKKGPPFRQPPPKEKKSKKKLQRGLKGFGGFREPSPNLRTLPPVKVGSSRIKDTSGGSIGAPCFVLVY